MPIVDYEKIKLEQLRKNVKELKSSDVQDKIELFSKRTGYSVEQINEKIDGDDMFKWFFAKDPIKQNIHENTAMNYIKQIEGVRDFKKFNTNEAFVVNGGILSGTELLLKQIRAKTKSIDFYWKYDDIQFFVSHKYTKDEGGGQTNQYNDLISFINECNGSPKNKTKFLAIADGEFYNTNDVNAGKSKIRHLQDIADRRNTHAMTINDLAEFMTQL